MSEYNMFNEMNKKNLQVWINKRLYKDQYWVRFFPMKTTPYLTYETLIGSEGNRVMADVVSYNSSAPLKTRKSISKLTGSIPSIRVKRQMTESDINDYNAFKAMATPDMGDLLRIVFNDTDFCMDAILGRLEWLALQCLALGQISLSKVNNVGGVVTEEVVNFQLAPANKKDMVSAARCWNAGDAALIKPITDIRTVVKAAKTAGANPQYILMNDSKFSEMVTANEVKNFVMPYTTWGITKIQMVPSLSILNQALKAMGLPQIIIIDTRVAHEDKDHKIENVDPWLNAGKADKHVVFIDAIQCGNTLRGPIAEETNPPKQVVQAKKGGILISSWSEIDPVTQYTKGEINAFPSCPSIDHIYNLDTEATTWAV
ncbi:hypothetical protein ES695_01690 [Candidatus Atribacteria bacterium 1244-E10-H5-B2]|nr:MAG: hypothetical protein ES695_01690 [Candidatus Atribacteria bacterium 1244-E10-H5-B2]